MPYKRVDGRIVIRADAILRRLRKELTQARPGREDELDIELDLINITKRAKRKHAERVAPHFKAQPRYSSCRPTEPLTIGNLALEVPSLEPEVSQVPIVNLKPQFIAEAMLESQLEVLAEEDKLLVREFFKAYPLIKRYALMPNVYVRLGIEDAAENSPRRVIILGIVLKGRV